MTTRIDTEIREGLQDAASRRAEGHRIREQATEDLVHWLHEARRAKMSMTEAARLAEISRWTAYELLKD